MQAGKGWLKSLKSHASGLQQKVDLTQRRRLEAEDETLRLRDEAKFYACSMLFHHFFNHFHVFFMSFQDFHVFGAFRSSSASSGGTSQSRSWSVPRTWPRRRPSDWRRS